MSLVLLSYWRHPEYIQNLWGPVNNASWSCLPFSLLFLPISLFPFFFFPSISLSLSSLMLSPSLPWVPHGESWAPQSPWGEQEGRWAKPVLPAGWSTGCASSSTWLGTCCLCATLLPRTLLRQVVLVGRDAAWVAIYSCFLRKPGLSEELCSSVGLSWVRDSGSGNGRKASFYQQ